MDIDIDVPTKTNPIEIFPESIRASMVEDGELKKHPVGVYFQRIPVDEKTGLSAIPYKISSSFGYFKIDIIHLKLLDMFESRDQLKRYMYTEPDWSMLQDKSIVSQLFHLSNSYDVVSLVAPKSVLELADCLALIRPGKTKLINSYIKDKKATRVELYRKEKPSDLRKSHALPYAYLVIAQLNLIKEKLDNETERNMGKRNKLIHETESCSG